MIRTFPEPELQLKAFLARTGVNAILIEDGSPRSADLNALASRLSLSRIKVGGVSLYRVAAGAFADYREVSGMNGKARRQHSVRDADGSGGPLYRHRP